MDVRVGLWRAECWKVDNFWTVVLEKTLESPLDCKEIQPVHPKGDQSWVFIGRTDVEAETPILWPPDGKSWLIGKGPDAGRNWGQEKGTTEDEMVGWHHWLDGYGSGWTPGVGDGQGGLACCGSWGCKESDTTEQLNWTELNWKSIELEIQREISWIPNTNIDMVKSNRPLFSFSKAIWFLLPLAHLGYGVFLKTSFLSLFACIKHKNDCLPWVHLTLCSTPSTELLSI